MSQATRYTSLFEEDDWFGALDAGRRHELLTCCRLRRLVNGETLYTLGDPADGLYGVVSGQVQLVNFQPDGSQVISIVVQPGQWFGELSMLDGKPRPNEAVAAGETVVAVLGMAAFQGLIATSFEYYRDVALLICLRSRWAADNLTSVLGNSAEARLARVLYGLAKGARNHGKAIHLNQDDLAGMVGISRQRVNMLLRKFEKGGLIALGRARIDIFDEKALALLAE